MKILFLDIETAPNLATVWSIWKQNIGINQLIDSSYTMCWAAKWKDSDEIIFDSELRSGKEGLVAHAWELLNEADAVVHYNGERFDIPTLNREFLLYGMDPPDPYKQIDLLQTVKKQFRFTSNKLDYVSQQLGLGSKTKHEGHELWLKCMEMDPVAWEKMQEYNVNDVILLEKVYNRILPWITSHPNHALYVSSPDRPVCTNCGSTHVIAKGITHLSSLSYQRWRCKDCGTNLRGRTTITPADQRRATLVQVR
jgi:uncharacterized protein YprB with RNaseH-like and TPR domain/ribosomal protein L37AE/L43A